MIRKSSGLDFKKTVIAGVFTTILSSTAFGAGNTTEVSVKIEVTAEEKKDTSIHNFPLAEDIAGTNLEEQRDQYLRKQKRRLGFTRKGGYIGWGQAPIGVSPKNIDFGQKRTDAFIQAFTNAKGEYVRTKRQKVAVSLVKKFFHDDRDHQEVEVKDGRIVGIGKKILALGEAALDRMLVDLGVDPKDIENSDIKKKRTLAENSLNKEMTVKSVQSISGIIILATFEDLKGVGVLIVQSPKYAELAKAIVSKKIVPVPTEEAPEDYVAIQLDEKFYNKKDLIPQYGVRTMLDSVGNRVLVSFGQWSPKVTRGESQMAINMAVTAAEKLAYNEALSYMTQFVKTTLSLENKSAMASSDKIEQLSKTDGTEEINETSSVGAMVNEIIAENSSWDAVGVTTVKTWKVNHPDTGHLIVGRVLMWSPVTKENAEQKPQKKRYGSNKGQNNSPTQNNVYQSVDFGETNDF